MLESLRCPSCSTHYGLRPQRVSPALRRAKCFRCGDIFDIGEVVDRLLAPPPEAVLEEVPGLSAGDLAGLDFQDDLFSGEPASMAPVDVEPTQPPEEAESIIPASPEDAGHYLSAKDAISKLLGDVPPTPAARPFASNRSANPMDVEATLAALEDTLGNVMPSELSGPNLNSTVRMDRSEFLAAIQNEPIEEGQAAAAQTMSIPISEIPLTPPAKPEEPTLPPPQPIPVTVPTAQDPSMLKLRIGEDLYENLSTDQICTWIEQGRVLENHLVARQFSENWIEALKVPTLRPVFERMRRLRSVLPEEAPAAPPQPEPAPRRSLFGGLFGRN